MPIPDLRTLDLFCGAGGLSQGFKAAGFRCVFANDHEAPAAITFAHNHPDAEVSSESIEAIDAGAIRRKLGVLPGELATVTGGPPCQGFSTYGRRDPDDHRNQLYVHFFRFVEEFRPRAFVMENVVGLLSMEGGAVVADILRRAARLGYSARVETLDAVEYGVPQFRKRVFVLGARDGLHPEFPAPTHQAGEAVRPIGPALFDPTDGMPRAVTVREAIDDLPADVLPPRSTQQSCQYPPGRPRGRYQEAMRDGAKTLTHHSAKQMIGIRRLRLALIRPGEYGTRIRARLREEGLPDELVNELLAGGPGMRNIDECRTEDREKERKLRAILSRGRVDIDEVLARLDSGGFANKYRRLNWDQPSHTLVAHMARDCSDFVHPEVARFLSVREAARLQSFPDTYRFPGSQFQQFRQIGNAVPPLLAEAIASAVREALKVPRVSRLRPAGT